MIPRLTVAATAQQSRGERVRSTDNHVTKRYRSSTQTPRSMRLAYIDRGAARII
jgi:hypothetical protein